MAKPVFSAKHFHDEQAAFDHIEALLWANGPVCPHCGGEGYACQVQFTVRVGTIFEDSRAPMQVGCKPLRC